MGAATEQRSADALVALVVDPDEPFRRLLASMLGGVVDEVWGVSDVPAARDLVQHSRPAVVVVDPVELRAGLPDLADALAETKDRPRIPMLACTGRTMRRRELDRLRIDAVLPHRLLSVARLSRQLFRLCPALRQARLGGGVAVRFPAPVTHPFASGG